MGFTLSPAVTVKETDLTVSVQSVATSIGATVINASWGVANEVTTITDESSLALTFGKPDATNYKDWICAANFLAYSADLRVVRVLGTGALNADDAGTGKLVENQAAFDVVDADVAYTGNFIAKYAGLRGNGITVEVSSAPNFVGWTYEAEFESAPSGTQFHVVVLENGVLVEKFAAVDTDMNAVDYQGQSTYATNVLARTSQFVWLANASSLIVDNAGAAVTYTLAGAAAGALPTDGEYQAAFDLYADVETLDVNLVFTGGVSALAGKYVVENISSVRKDCITFVSPQEVECVGLTATAATAAILANRATQAVSSYGTMDGNYKYQYDRYNDVHRWIPLNGDIAGLCANTDNVRDPWYSPGGFNRGQIKNVTRLAFHAKKAHRDQLYNKSVNPVVTFQGEGTILFGDRTMLAKPSAFRSLPARRLFIVLEKAIATAAKYTLFELNTVFTRARFKQMVEPFLRDVQGRQGIIKFAVKCDESNNTEQVINNGDFIAGIYILPSRSINGITLDFVAVKDTVTFTEVIG